MMALPATVLLTAQAASEGTVCQYAAGASALAEAPFLPGKHDFSIFSLNGSFLCSLLFRCWIKRY